MAYMMSMLADFQLIVVGTEQWISDEQDWMPVFVYNEVTSNSDIVCHVFHDCITRVESDISDIVVLL